MIEMLAELAKGLPKGTRERAEKILAAFQPTELSTMLHEVKAAARAAKDASTRAQVVDRMLSRIAGAAGIELSVFERTVLRMQFIRLVSSSGD